MSKLMIIFLMILSVFNEKAVGKAVRTQQRYKVGERIIARWTNNKYYGGEVSSFDQVNKTIDVAFDDCDATTHKTDDISAVIRDQEPVSIKYKDHVIAPFLRSYTQIIGFVTAVCTSKAFKIRLDNNYNTWFKKNELRIFPDASSPHDVGARVFARWTDRLYYRGFVNSSNSSTVSINYDDGDKITLSKNDKTAVVLDKIPSEGEVTIGQKVIGYWPNRARFYPGYIQKMCDCGKKYYLIFDDGDERCQEIFEIRTYEEDQF